MKYNLYYIQLINTKNMKTIEISRISSSCEHLIEKMNAIVRYYNDHECDIDKVRIFNTDRKLLVSYDL